MKVLSGVCLAVVCAVAAGHMCLLNPVPRGGIPVGYDIVSGPQCARLSVVPLPVTVCRLLSTIRRHLRCFRL